jgi:hypothetical protein
LPTLELPSFSGQYTEWTALHDTFSSLIENNDQLNGVQKFHYLKSCLKGEAGKVIESLTISNENYKLAWHVLIKRYDNKRLIIQDHVFAIVNAPPIQKSSHDNLRQLFDNFNIHMEALKVQNIDTSTWNAIVIPIVAEKLDFTSKREWQAGLTSEVPTIDQFKTFLENRCKILESLFAASKTQVFVESNQQQKSKGKSRSVVGVTTNKPVNKQNNQKPNCHKCNEPHLMFYCPEFINTSVRDRINFVKNKNLCANCFKSDHQTKDCRSNYTCKMCNLKHNSMLHIARNSENQAVNQPTESTLSVNACQVYFTNVLLPTAVVKVFDNTGRPQKLRALLDSASQINFLTEEASKRLKLSCGTTQLSISGINQTVTSTNKTTQVEIHSNKESFKTTISCVIKSQITENLPTILFPTTKVEIPNDKELSDPTFNISGPIDMLIGAQNYWELVKGEPQSLGRNKPWVVPTFLGWVVSGPLARSHSSELAKSSFCHVSTVLLDQQIQRFWEMEQYGDSTCLSQNEELCKHIFRNTHRRKPDGRYSVQLPFKDHKTPDIGLSRDTAVKRFHALEAKFRQNPQFKREYKEVINDYLILNHAEKEEQQQRSY